MENQEVTPKPGASPARPGSLRWHRLSEIRIGHALDELMAATCVDGIGVIAKWCRDTDGGWIVEALDTENQEWAYVDFREGEPVPAEPPTIFDDISANDRTETPPTSGVRKPETL